MKTTLSHLYKQNECAQTGHFRGTSIFATLCNLNVTPNYLLKLYICFFFFIFAYLQAIGLGGKKKTLIEEKMDKN